MLIESGIVGEGSVKGVLNGKHYNRSIFSHKVVYEAMQRLRFETFLDNLDEQKEDRIVQFLCQMYDAFPDESFCQHVECQVFEEISDEYDAFIIDASNKSKTFAFWSMYIKLIGKFKYSATHACATSLEDLLN